MIYLYLSFIRNKTFNNYILFLYKEKIQTKEEYYMYTTNFDILTYGTEFYIKYKKLDTPKQKYINYRYEYPKNMFMDIYPEEMGYPMTYTDARGLKILERMKTILSSRELYILELYYKNKLTLKEIGDILHISATRVGQFLKSIRRKMRHPCQSIHIRKTLLFGNVIINSDNESDVRNILIDNIDISNRGLMILTSFNIYTIKHLIQFTKIELAECFKLDNDDINIIITFLNNNNIQLLTPITESNIQSLVSDDEKKTLSESKKDVNIDKENGATIQPNILNWFKLSDEVQNNNNNDIDFYISKYNYVIGEKFCIYPIFNYKNESVYVIVTDRYGNMYKKSEILKYIYVNYVSKMLHISISKYMDELGYSNIESCKISFARISSKDMLQNNHELDMGQYLITISDINDIMSN